MTSHPYALLTRYKRWADRGLHEVVAANRDRLAAEDAMILVRILDHILVVDRIFQHHLEGVPHPFQAPYSKELPDLPTLTDEARHVDDWYASYAGHVSARDLDEPVEFVFTNGAQARMSRGEIILHVCLHGTSHRGNASFLLQKNGILPHKDRMTDFIETAV
jgi:uncharacterized damage-inducible protein DinB